MAGNFSQHLYIFSALAAHRQYLINISNTTRVLNANIVPNDPADFARNSFDSQTLNSILSSLKHNHIDILKIDSNIDGVQTHDLLHFLVLDKILDKVKELHIVVKLGESYL